ncbi:MULTISPECIES: ead/Ea22-like family protein [unclassified Pseudomonas]|uniref:ead/Ea22-like family protein n=1 Tax=unclassified Pseudomonas TaxID=196821 RepID=UPI00131D573B|nr:MULTISPECIES: ead/Ea22-like family protein [unclassified Pseudomonas]
MTILVQQQLRDLLGKLTTAFWRNDGILVCPAYRDGETVYVESWRPVAEAASTDYARFIAAANPAVVLALLDELDAANANHENAVAHMQSVCAERDQLKAENAELKAQAELQVLLPELDEALEDLEIWGRHSDQGYRKLKDWYRKVSVACKSIDQAMTKEQP